MRVMIWGDMEGVACICSWEQVSGGQPLYQECRVLYTEEMNAAVRGAKRAGATDIIAVDNHGAGGGFSFKSMVPERLERGARWVLGAHWSKYIEPLQAGVDAIVFVGAHSMAGTPDGVLSHTISGVSWYRATVNGVPVGESGIIAAIGGSFGAPGVFVSGDRATCQEVVDLLGDRVVTAPVKEGFGRFATISLAPIEAREMIEERVYQVLQQRAWPEPYQVEPPVEFRIELQTVDQARAFRGRPGVELVDSRTVVSCGKTFWEAWDRIWAED